MHEELLKLVSADRVTAVPATNVEGVLDSNAGVVTLAVPIESLYLVKVSDPKGNTAAFVEFHVTMEAMERFRNELNRTLPDGIKLHNVKKIRRLEEQLARLKNDPEVVSTNPSWSKDYGREVPEEADDRGTDGSGAP